MHRCLILIGLLACLSCTKVPVPSSLVSTSPVRVYSSSKGLSLTSMEPAQDGGYIFCGHTPAGAGLGDLAFLMKTKANGDIEWQKTFGGAQVNGFLKARQTKDGGYISVGYSSSYGFGPKSGVYYADAWMVKTDAQGNQVWQNTFGNVYGDTFYDVKEMPDQGFVMATRFDDTDAYWGKPPANFIVQAGVVRTDNMGKGMWVHEFYKTQYRTNAQSIDLSPSGDIVVGCMIVKSNASSDQASFFPGLLYINTTGRITHLASVFSTLGLCKDIHIVAATDGVYMAFDGKGSGINNINLFKVGYNGKIIWQKQFASNVWLSDFRSAGNGNYYLSASNYLGKSSMVFTSDASGNLISSVNCQNSTTGTNDQNAVTIATVNGFPTPTGWAFAVSVPPTYQDNANKFVLTFTDKNGKINDHE